MSDEPATPSSSSSFTGPEPAASPAVPPDGASTAAPASAPPFDMPPSLPPGMRLELSRARLLPGAEAETDRWMQMLHDRYDECLQTLAGERMAFEATFRHRDSDGVEWLYHLSVYGEGGAVMDMSHAVDREHVAFARRCKEPGWEELRPVLFLAPAPVRAAMESWARDGAGDVGD